MALWFGSHKLFRCLSAAVFTLLLTLPAKAQANEPLQVVATFSIIGDMVKEIGGELVAVSTLVGPNGDVHVYEPTPSDARTIAGAKLVVVNGMHMEGWLDRLVKVSGAKAAIAIASRGVAPRDMDRNKDANKNVDPHAWQDLSNGQIYVRNIAESLAEVDPANAAIYRQRAKNYSTELGLLDLWVRQTIGQVPEEKRKIVTSHDAFGYFGKAYGVSFLGLTGLSTESETTATRLAKLVMQIKTDGIKSVFVENMTDSRLMETLKRETGVVIGAPVYSDSLSLPGDPADTYIKMFRHNVLTFVSGMK